MLNFTQATTPCMLFIIPFISLSLIMLYASLIGIHTPLQNRLDKFPDFFHTSFVAAMVSATMFGVFTIHNIIHSVVVVAG